MPNPNRSKGQTEKEIQTECLNHLISLELQGKCYHFRSGAGAVATIRPNGSKGFFKTGKAGVPDITLLYKGQFIGLEIKKEGGKQSPAQLETESKIQQQGGWYFVITSLDQLKETLKMI
jgi:hypothetical protein